MTNVDTAAAPDVAFVADAMACAEGAHESMTTPAVKSRRPIAMTANTLTYTDRFYTQIATLAKSRHTNIRALTRAMCAAEVRRCEREIDRHTAAPDDAEQEARRRASDLPVSSSDTRTHTLTFSTPLYVRMKALAKARGGISIRELVRVLAKIEIETALKFKEVSGATFDGPIGEDPYDLVQPQFTRQRRTS